MKEFNSHALREQLMAISALEPGEIDDFVAAWTPISVPRKQILTQAGDVEHYLYFAQSGVQRIYYLDDQGREATLMFSYTHTFSGVVDSFFTRQPSRYYYETLTPSELLKIPFAEYERLTMRHPALVKMALSGLSGALSGVMERLVEVQSFTSEEKFRAMLSRSPHILQMVPHKHLANYLGIDATNFSKLLNRVKI